VKTYLPPEKQPTLLIVKETGWVPALLWTLRRRCKPLTSIGSQTSAPRSSACSLVAILTPVHSHVKYNILYSVTSLNGSLRIINNTDTTIQSRDSAVAIATVYELGDQGVGVRGPVGQELSLLYVVQTGSGAHPASYSTGTRDCIPGGTEAEVKKTWIYTSTPPYAFMA
jgi:hypothetical protein